MVMRKILGAVGLILALAASSHADIEDTIANLKAAVAVQIEGDAAENLGRQLSKSGMADTDVQRTVTELSEAAALCFVNALMKQAEEQSLDVEQVLSNADASIGRNSGKEIIDGLDEEELKQKLYYCLLVTYENAGVESPLIAP